MRNGSSRTNGVRNIRNHVRFQITKSAVLRQAYAPNTRKKYDAAWKRFLTFLCLHKQLSTEPIYIGVPLFKDYAIWRFNISNVAGDTIGSEISDINSYLNDMDKGINLHNFTGEPLTRLKRGIDAVYAQKYPNKTRVVRKAFVDRILDPNVSNISDNTQWKRHIKACLTVAKHAALRSQNYVINDKSWHLKIKHCTFIPNNVNCAKLILKIPFSKTNQPHSRRLEIRTLKCRCSNDKACPVHLTWNIYKGRRNKPNDALFLKSNGQAMTYSAISAVLASICTTYKLDPRYYTTHSLRIGAATDAFQQGWTIARIMLAYYWKSRKTVMRYIRVNEDDAMRFQLQ